VQTGRHAADNDYNYYDAIYNNVDSDNFDVVYNDNANYHDHHNTYYDHYHYAHYQHHNHYHNHYYTNYYDNHYDNHYYTNYYNYYNNHYADDDDIERYAAVIMS